MRYVRPLGNPPNELKVRFSTPSKLDHRRPTSNPRHLYMSALLVCGVFNVMIGSTLSAVDLPSPSGTRGRL